MVAMKVLYIFGKTGLQADYWQREIEAASDTQCQYHTLNYAEYIGGQLCARAQLVDNLYYDRDRRLLRLYQAVQDALKAHTANILLADNVFPFHPEYLKELNVYKVLRTTDGPLAAYDRDIAYCHAYDLVLYHSPAYSPKLDMRAQLQYCGVKDCELWPLAVFDAHCNPTLSEEEVFAGERPIDIVFVGALWTGKLPWIAAVKRAFGHRFRIYGVASWRKKLYCAWCSRRPFWISRLPDAQYNQVYLESKIGINAHNRGKYTLGNYRLFDLPANGMLQLSDGDDYLQQFYEPGKEIVLYGSPDDLVDKLKYYLAHHEERIRIARAGYRRTMAEHRIGQRMKQLTNILAARQQRKLL